MKEYRLNTSPERKWNRFAELTLTTDPPEIWISSDWLTDEIAQLKIMPFIVAAGEEIAESANV